MRGMALSCYQVADRQRKRDGQTWEEKVGKTVGGRGSGPGAGRVPRMTDEESKDFLRIGLGWGGG